MERDIQGAVSPIDGRYHQRTKVLANYFSEEALIGYRTYMEIHYLLWLAKYAKENGTIRISEISDQQIEFLKEFASTAAFTETWSDRVKAIEKETNHDVKAVVDAIREMLQEAGFPKAFIAHVHFGLTSEDVTNIGIAHGIHDGNREVIIDALEDVLNGIWHFAHVCANTPMLARTHGQPATPTTFGKEMMIFVQRLKGKIDRIRNFRMSVKLNGASGNYNGHVVAYPAVDWPQLAYEFIMETYKGIDGPYFTVNLHTNQIEDHDTYAELFSIFMQLNVVLKNFCKDVWLYISYGIVTQKKVEGETGSTAMPHKVNPIDFENAEGNIEVANALFGMFCGKLPDSRMQRDLSDSTIERNFGTAFAYCLIAYKSIIKGLGKIAPNEVRMKQELDEHPEILAEANQLVLKKHGIEDAYEQLKKLTRGEEDMTLEIMHQFLDTADIPEEDKERLRALTPSTYLGLAPRLAIGFDVVDPNYRLKE